LVHLANFFFKRHLLEQFFGFAVRFDCGHDGGLRGNDRRSNDEEKDCENDGSYCGLAWHDWAGPSEGPLSIKHGGEDLQED
jgi:hypothetical protein